MAPIALQTHSPRVTFERERGLYGLQVTPDIAHLRTALPEDATRSSHILHITRVLADAAIPIFLIKLHHATFTFALHGEHLSGAMNVLTNSGQTDIQSRRDLAMITLCAASLRDVPNLMENISDALYAAGTHLFEIGDSHNSAQCLIEAAYADSAAVHLCGAFGLNEASIERIALKSGTCP